MTQKMKLKWVQLIEWVEEMKKKICYELMITPFLTVNNFIFYLHHVISKRLDSKFLFVNKNDLKMSTFYYHDFHFEFHSLSNNFVMSN